MYIYIYIYIYTQDFTLEVEAGWILDTLQAEQFLILYIYILQFVYIHILYIYIYIVTLKPRSTWNA